MQRRPLVTGPRATNRRQGPRGLHVLPNGKRTEENGNVWSREDGAEKKHEMVFPTNAAFCGCLSLTVSAPPKNKGSSYLYYLW